MKYQTVKLVLPPSGAKPDPVRTVAATGKKRHNKLCSIAQISHPCNFLLGNICYFIGDGLTLVFQNLSRRSMAADSPSRPSVTLVRRETKRNRLSRNSTRCVKVHKAFTLIAYRFIPSRTSF